MRQAATGLAGLALGLGVLAGIVWLIGAGDTFRTLARLHPWQGVALVAVALAGTGCASLALELMFRRTGDRVSAWLLFRLSLVAFAVGFFLPSGYVAGFPLVAWVLHRRGVRFGHALAPFLIQRFFEMATFAVALPFVVLTGLREPGAVLWLAALGPVAGVIVGALDVALGWRLARSFLGIVHGRAPRALKPLIDEAIDLCATIVAFFHGPLALVAGAFGFSVLSLGATFSRAFLTTRFLALGFGLPQVALLLGFTLLILSVPFAPGALGLYEGGMVGVFGLLGRTSAEGVAYAMIAHGVELVVAAIGFAFLAQLGIDFAALREAGRRRVGG